MKKNRSICFSLIMILCFSGIASAYVNDPSNDLQVNTYPVSSQIMEVIEKEAPIVETYNRIIDSFDIIGDRVEYPDNFGGAYMEDLSLHINLTDNRTNEIENHIMPYTDVQIVYHVVPYSYEELYALSMQIINLNLHNITSIGVNDKENTIDIGINRELFESNGTNLSEKEFLAEQRELLQELISKDLKTEINDIFDLSDLPLQLFLETPAYTSATTLTGGRQLKISGTSTSFTLGVCGTYWGNSASGEPAVLSCGHDMTVGNTIVDNSANRNLGTIEYKKFTANERYDYSIITIDTPSSYTLTNKVANNSSYTTITDIATSNLVGTTVCKYGYNGEFATGTIVYSDRQVYYNNQNCYIFGLVHVDLESGTCVGGDSGGPVYSGHDFYGTVSGSGSNRFYYSPITGVQNFTVKTS